MLVVEKQERYRRSALHWDDDDDDEKENDQLECGMKMHNQEMEGCPEST